MENGGEEPLQGWAVLVRASGSWGEPSFRLIS